jgi:hypothetical protein
MFQTTNGRAGDGELRHRCGGPSRAIAHIGFPLSGIVAGGQLSFLEVHPIRQFLH